MFQNDQWKTGIILLFFLTSRILFSQSIFTDYYATYMGTVANERIGYAMNPAGDINNDGLDDWVMGTFHYNVGGWDRGAVYIGLGKPEDQGMNKWISQLDARFIGTHDHDGIGYSVSAGDINGDGYDDILIGGPDGAGIPGHAYLIFGKSNVDWGMNADVNQAAAVRFNGTENGEGSGLSVSVIGDMDGDGCSEFLIGSPMHPTSTLAGKVGFFKGKPSGWTPQIDLRYPDILFSTTSRQSRLGYWVDGVGDVNGDDIPDFAMGAWGVASSNDHRVYVFFGRESMNWASNTDVSNADVVLYSAGLGWNVRPAGDVNGDGYDDFIMSDLSYESNRGIVYLVLGRAVFPSSMGPGSMSASFYGENSGDVAGFWISHAGDVNADGLDDFMIGAQNYSIPNTRNGKAYMVLGRAAGWSKNTPLSSIPNTLVGETTETIQLGECVAYLGDINGDGGDDYAVAAPYFDPWGIKDAGKIYVFKGLAQRTVTGECVHDPSGRGVPGVTLSWEGYTAATDADGAYTCHVNGFTDFRITPSKTPFQDVPFGAISAYDASLIARYEIGLAALDSDQRTAADVNEDSQVDMMDAVCVARASVGMDALSGTHAGEWRFDPEYREYSGLTQSPTGQNYSLRLMGDVDRNWGDVFSAKPAESFQDIALHVLPSGQGARLSLISETDTEVYSVEMILEFDPDAVRSVRPNRGTAASVMQLFHKERNGEVRACLFGVQPAGRSGALMECDVTLNAESVCMDVRYRINNHPFVRDCLEIQANASSHPDGFRLTSHPNPFNPATLIQVHLPEDARLDLTVYNLSGQPVKQLCGKTVRRGIHRFSWDGRNASGENVSSGMYLCRARAGSRDRTLKLVKAQ